MTPFDDLAVELLTEWRKPVELGQPPDEVAKKISLCTTFVLTCQVRYAQMIRASKKQRDRFQALRTQTYGIISTEEYLAEHTDLAEVRISFFDFILELNRFGRIFEGEYKATIPNYHRIKFYRDKMVEHWDEYGEFLQKESDGLVLHPEKPAIPYHVGQRNDGANRQVSYRQLRSEFSKLGATFPDLDITMLDKDYAEGVFAGLEQVYPKLGGIPRRVVDMLFKYAFPLPIHDLDEYSNELCSWIRTFLASI